jgi:3-hydroxyisobutyrate dehydrogenase
MGSRMAANLAAAGFPLTVWNRTTERAERWVERNGGTLARDPAQVASRSDVLITMVVDGAQVESVLLGEGGAAEGAHDGLLCVDMSTIGPTAARRIGERLAKRGVPFLDAPVTGSSPKAEDGTLTIMAGGDERDFLRARPLLEVMGELIVHAGPLGHGQMVKLINNTVAAANAAVLAQALLLGRATGVDLESLVRVMSAGAAGSVMLDLKARAMLEHDFTTLFKLEHMLKDLRLCLGEAEAVGVGMPLEEQVAGVLQEAVDQGLGERDFAALLEVLEQRAGTRL